MSDPERPNPTGRHDSRRPTGMSREKVRAHVTPPPSFRRAARKQGVHTEPEIRANADITAQWLLDTLDELKVWQRLARWAIKYVLKRLGA